MSNAQTNTLVLKDQAGDYYLLPLETLERGRVPAERTAEMERAIAATTQGGAGEADAEGYALPLAFAFAGVLMGGMAGGISLGRWWRAEEGIAPDFTIPSSEPAPWSR